MSIKVNDGLTTGSVTVEDSTIGSEVSRDTVNAEPIKTEAASERSDEWIDPITEMVVTRSMRTELQLQLEEQERTRELNQWD